MRIALDTNQYSAFCDGDRNAVDAVQDATEIWLPFIVLGELRAGFRAGSRQQKNERMLTEFLKSPRVQVLVGDETTTHFYADLRQELRSAGTPIPTNDIWIAALVIQHDLVLVSRDKHFDVIPRLPRI